MEAFQLKRPETPELQLVKATVGKSHFFHPFADAFFVGGLSILLFITFQFLPSTAEVTAYVAGFALITKFAINLPHFLATYFIFYKDYRIEMMGDRKFAWAGIFAPVLLFSLFLFLTWQAERSQSQKFLHHIPLAVFFFATHHYVKQAYGCILILSAKAQVTFNRNEKVCLKWAMYSLLMVTFVDMNLFFGTKRFFDVQYTSLEFDRIWLSIAYTMSFISLSVLATMLLKKYVHEKKVMPLSAWAALISIALWFIPAWHPKVFSALIPFFHGLQYLFITTFFVKAKAEEEALRQAEVMAQRKSFYKQLGFYLLFIAVAGALVCDLIPKHLDKTTELNPILGTTYYLFIFHAFLNLHHFLIDSVIWRKDNHQLNKLLN